MGNVVIFGVIILNNENKFFKILFMALSYVAVAAVAMCVAFTLTLKNFAGVSKLEQLESIIMNLFIGEADQTAMGDAAASAMVGALGDRWSYYIPAAEYEAYQQQMNNSYVGVGITISVNEEKYIDILQVDPNGGAKEAGITPGDVLIKVEGQDVAELGIDKASELVRGEEGTEVTLTVRRGEEEKTFTVTRRTIEVTVAEGQMLENNIGLVKIANFDARCAQETIAVIEKLVSEGASALIFDVRFNPGGYRHELVDLLDYLLPEGKLFQSVSTDGTEETDTSDKKCLQMPMAVLMNGESYSAAEFFAAALEEYDWAITVGEATCGKGYFQTTIELNDGSAVGLSVGKYFTPKGVSLAEVGGLKPNVEEKVDADTAADIYAGILPVEKDPQIQAAIKALQKED